MEDNKTDSIHAAILTTPFSKDTNCIVICADIAKQLGSSCVCNVGDRLSITISGDDNIEEDCEYEIVRVYDNGDILICKAHYLTAIQISEAISIKNINEI